MTRLDLLDPTSADDPAFDPGGPQADRVRRAATARRRPARTPLPPVRRLALAGTAVTFVAAVVLAVSTGTQPTDARAALAQAAEDTAAHDSGRIILTYEFGYLGKGAVGSGRTEVRFSGDDMEVVVRDDFEIDGKRIAEHRTVRLVDSTIYSRDDAREGAPFEYMEGVGMSDTDPMHLLVSQVGSEALVDLVRGASDLEQVEGPDGTTIYRGTRTMGEVFDAAPTTVGRGEEGWDAPSRLEVAVGDDGLIRRVTTRETNDTRTLEYADLGEEQAIEKPQNAVRVERSVSPS